MDSFSLYRDRIGQTLTTRLADAMEQEVITLEESSIIAQAILDGVNGAKNHEELMNFIEDLAHKWTLFGPVLVSENTQQLEEQEKAAVDEVSNLLKENKIDEAIAAAEQATHDTQIEVAPLEQPATEILTDQPQQNAQQGMMDQQVQLPVRDSAPPITDTPLSQEILDTTSTTPLEQPYPQNPEPLPQPQPTEAPTPTPSDYSTTETPQEQTQVNATQDQSSTMGGTN